MAKTTLTPSQHLKLETMSSSYKVVGWDLIGRGPIIQMPSIPAKFTISRRGDFKILRGVK
jgi:hypothetical protein